MAHPFRLAVSSPANANQGKGSEATLGADIIAKSGAGAIPTSHINPRVRRDRKIAGYTPRMHRANRVRLLIGTAFDYL